MRGLTDTGKPVIRGECVLRTRMSNTVETIQVDVQLIDAARCEDVDARLVGENISLDISVTKCEALDESEVWKFSDVHFPSWSFCTR